MMIVMMSTLTGTWSNLGVKLCCFWRRVPTSTPGEVFYGNALQAASYGSHEAVVRLLLENADVHAQGGTRLATHSWRRQLAVMMGSRASREQG